jgi:uncharacterized membrane protein YdjX (TVP38/TMEM64 family)
MAEGVSEAGTQASRGSLARVAIGIIAVVALFIVGRQAGHYVPQFAEWVASLGVWGPIVFIVGYAVAVVAFVPGSILTLAAGAIFGLAGVVYVFVAAVIGSCAAFLISRYLARNWVEQRLAGNPKFAAVDRAVAREGRKIIFLLRMSPLFPFNLLNYALGLTKVSFIDYAVAGLGMLPGTLLYVYYGKLAGDVAALAGGAAVAKGSGYYTVLAIGLVATIAVTAVVTRTAQRALKDVAGE